MAGNARGANRLPPLLVLPSLLLLTPSWLRAQEPPPTESRQTRTPSKEPLETAGCVTCGRLYAADCYGALWSIDMATLDATRIGTLPGVMLDIGINAEGRLFGISESGDLWELSACDASGVLRASAVYCTRMCNGLTGERETGDVLLDGPPILRFETGGSTTSDVGGASGLHPPAWCGHSSGDLAANPADGLLYAALLCGASRCPASTLVALDPETGDAVREVGCILGPGGAYIGSAIWGLAFDDHCNLWAGQGNLVPALYRLDLATATATEVPLTGGYMCTNGLASWPACTDPTACVLTPRGAGCGLERLAPPLAPARPAAPASAGSACSRALARIVCGAAPGGCPAGHEVQARLRVTRHELGRSGCRTVVETFAVRCDETVELARKAPPCRPGKPPKGRGSTWVRPDGIRGFAGEGFALEVRAGGACGATSAPCEARPGWLCAPPVACSAPPCAP